MAETDPSSILDLTTGIVAAFVANNDTKAQDLPSLIQSVQKALLGVTQPESVAEEPKAPAVPIRRSITPDYMICLEDGRKFRTLKRHLRTKYGLSPDDYRAKWGLAKDYPMVAPNYAAARSRLAKEAGLGQGGRPAAKATPSKATGVKATPGKATRRAKVAR